MLIIVICLLMEKKLKAKNEFKASNKNVNFPT